MNEAKIQFSQDELILVENAEWILTKNTIIRKICDMFGMLANEMSVSLHPVHLPDEVKQTTAKISKGENYRGLPYVVLDYPRLFTKENVFAIRVLFWWAHYFSITWHLKGLYKEIFLANIRKKISVFSDHDFYISISKDEWSHVLHENDYIPVRNINEDLLEKIFAENEFLKVSAKVNIQQWNQAEEQLFKLFSTIVEVLDANVGM